MWITISKSEVLSSRFVLTVSVAPPRNLRASTPLLIDGHAVGNADINRRVVIRTYAPCLAWKTIFHAGDKIVVAQSDRSSVSFLPSFLSSSSSKLLSSFPPSFSLSRLLVRSLTHALPPIFFLFTRRPSFLHMVSCVGVPPASGRNFIRFVSSIQGQTYIDSYSHVYSPRTSLVLVERANRSAGDFH